MTTPRPDRPEPRPRGGAGGGPRPAPDEDRDPIEPPPAVPQAPAPRRGRARTVQSFNQLNTRVDPLLSELIEKISDERGWSKRQTVEWALKQAYPSEYRQLEADPNAG